MEINEEMEINDDANKMIENRINKILKEIDIPESDKSEIKKELLSNYIDASIIHAQTRGATSVTKEDTAPVLETSESPEEIASMYMASYVNSLQRAGLITRSIAYIIDTAITSIFTVIAASPFILVRYLLGPETNTKMGIQPLFVQFFYLLVIANLIIIFLYFAICEGFYGYTPGKWLLGLKVLRTDGKRTSFRESMLRSIPKLFIIAILADALLMTTLYRKEKQRLFDKIAGTIVIHKNKPK